MNRISALWRAYLFVTCSSILAGSAMMYIEWVDVKKEINTELSYANGVITNTVERFTEKHFTSLNSIGRRYLSAASLAPEYAQLTDTQRAHHIQSILQEELAQSSGYISLGVYNENGHLLTMASNIASVKNAELMLSTNVDDALGEALRRNGVIYGNPYFMTIIGEWILPVYHKVSYDPEHRLKDATVVVIAEQRLNYAASQGAVADIPSHVNFLITDSDFQPVFRSSFSSPQDSSFFSDVVLRASSVASESIVSIDLHDGIRSREWFEVGEKYRHEFKLYSANFSEQSGFYIFASMNQSELWLRLAAPYVFAILFVLGFNIALFFLYKTNNRALLQSRVKLRYQASHDLLTRLPNRRYLMEKFYDWHVECDGQFSVIFIDLDNFKACNDLYGHSAGDRVLCEVANRVRRAFTGAMKIRQGGDEFIILTKQIQQSLVREECQHFLDLLKTPVVFGEHEFNIRASMGIVRAPFDGEKIDELLRKANMAMYEAKRLRKNVYVYSKSLANKNERSAYLEKGLNYALERNEFSLVYQPQISSMDQSIVGVEALLRWESPSLGDVSPEEFIPVAENTGQVYDIGLFVLETAIRELNEICERVNGVSPSLFEDGWQLRVSVNVSAAQLFSNKFLDALKDILNRHPRWHISLMVEVTESLFIEDLQKVKEVLEEIRALGIGVSLDDFGTGYSSLTYLSKLPIDELKIDRTFVRDILTDNQDWMLTQSVISLGKNMKIPVVAEGVENGQQMMRLSGSECELFQGYFFSKPMKGRELEKFLVNQSRAVKMCAIV